MTQPILSNTQVQNGATLDTAAGGSINATKINGVSIPSANSGTAGKLPIAQGDGTAAWSDPLVQGTYPPNTNVNTGGISGAPINPVLVGGSDYATPPLLHNIKIDANGQIYAAAGDGVDATQGSMSDILVLGDTAGTVSAKLRGLNTATETMRINALRMQYCQAILQAQALTLSMVQTGSFIPVPEIPAFLGGF